MKKYKNEVLHKWMFEHNVTAKVLADQLGICHNSMYKVLKGEPTLTKIIKKIAEHTGIELRDLVV